MANEKREWQEKSEELCRHRREITLRSMITASELVDELEDPFRVAVLLGQASVDLLTDAMICRVAAEDFLQSHQLLAVLSILTDQKLRVWSGRKEMAGDILNELERLRAATLTWQPLSNRVLHWNGDQLHKSATELLSSGVKSLAGLDSSTRSLQAIWISSWAAQLLKTGTSLHLLGQAPVWAARYAGAGFLLGSLEVGDSIFSQEIAQSLVGIVDDVEQRVKIGDAFPYLFDSSSSL